MIGSLQGKVLRIDGVTALIEVGGVGYEVDMPVTCLGNLKVGENTFVFIQHVVREDAQILYGFSSVEQRELFRTLIKVKRKSFGYAGTLLCDASITDGGCILLCK